MAGALVTTNGAALVGRSLPELELVIERGLQTFVEVGQALKEIRDRDLHHKAGYRNFNTYCKERWNFDRNRATQLIGAAETAEVITRVITSAPPLQNEKQARALNPLKEEPETMAAAWTEAVETAPNGKVTAVHVSAVVERYVEPGPAPETAVSEVPQEDRDFWAMLDTMDRLSRDLRDLRMAFANEIHAEDLTLTELRDVLGRVERMERSTQDIAALRTLAAERRIERGGKPMPRPTITRAREVTTQDREILAALRDAGEATSLDLTTRLGIPLYVLSARLSEMFKAGLVVRTGEKRGGANVHRAAEP